jgi:uncharacterized protein (DUF2384 family)
MPVTTSIRLEALVTDLGGRAEVARVIGVDRAQVTRWLDKGQDPDPENLRKVEAVELALARLLRLFDRDTALRWLRGTNALLGNRRPVDMLGRGDGLALVLGAIDGEEAGSFA